MISYASCTNYVLYSIHHILHGICMILSWHLGRHFNKASMMLAVDGEKGTTVSPINASYFH